MCTGKKIIVRCNPFIKNFTAELNIPARRKLSRGRKISNKMILKNIIDMFVRKIDDECFFSIEI